MRILLVCERADAGPRYETTDGSVSGGVVIFAGAAMKLLSKTQDVRYTTKVVCKPQLQHAHFLTESLMWKCFQDLTNINVLMNVYKRGVGYR